MDLGILSHGDGQTDPTPAQNLLKITFFSIYGEMQNGTAYLKLETVARGLGFTKTDVKVSETGFRKEYVRIDWPRVSGYLSDLGFSPEVGKDGFIPENIFYRLAMKAKNEAAEHFQAKVAEVLGYSNTKDALNSHVDPEDKQIIQRSENATFDIPNRGMTIVNESGLYNVILRSDELRAKLEKTPNEQRANKEKRAVPLLGQPFM